MFYPQDVIDQVIEANNIVDVISGYVKLTKKGSTYFGLCPFHSEKTPSFSVTDNGDRRMFYCFGCHTGGNVLTFLMKYESLSYTEALQTLADRAGITLPKPDYSREDAEKYKLKEQVLAVYKDAAVYYYHLLHTNRGAQAYQYLKKRELSDETIKSFGLGYSDKYRDDLYRYIKSKGYTDEVLKATGLFSIKETGVHDYFWNRVMFPIMDARSKVIAFGGRVMGDGEPKYLNSPETLIFEKRRNLFGLHAAKRHKGKEFILCEGYMDVIALHQAGFTNAVASLGTALTSSHAMLLKRYTSHVVLSYDSDQAGRNAAVRAIPILKGAGLNVRVINLKPYKDPDELIKAEGADSYRERLKTARNGVLFEIDMLKEGFDLADPDSKTRFYNETAKRLSAIEDEIERENYLQTVSREFEIDYSLLKSRTIRYALNRDESRPYEAGPEQSRPEREEGGRKNREQAALLESQKVVLSFLAEKPSAYPQIRRILNASDFTIPPYDRIAGLLFAQLQNGSVNPSGIISAFAGEEEQEQAAALFAPQAAQDGIDREELKKMVSDCVINIRKYSLQLQIEAESDMGRVLQLSIEKEKLNNLTVFS